MNDNMKYWNKKELIDEVHFLITMLESYKKLMNTYKFWYEYYAKETDRLREEIKKYESNS